jgi:hypothetical protein
VPIEGAGTITSAQFPALASMAANSYTDVYLNWTPNFTLTQEQIDEGTFHFHTCVRVRIDPVAGETVLANQDGDREQENISYFQATSTGPGPEKTLIHLHNDDLVNPKWFNLSYVSGLPPTWGLDVNGGKLSILLQPGEVQDIPVTITPKGTAVVGSTFGVDISASYFRNLVNNLDPKDKHMEFKALGGVRVESHVLAPPGLHCMATQQAPRRILVTGKLDGAAEFYEPNSPMFVMIQGVDVARNFQTQTSAVLPLDKDGAFSGYLNGDVKDWHVYEVAVMFAGTTKLASAIHYCPIEGITPPPVGDVTGDGIVGPDDAVDILRIAGGLQTGLPGQVAAADHDADGKLTVVDATWWTRLQHQGHASSVTLAAGNAYSNYGVYIDNPALNGDPNARLIATHHYVSTSNPVIGVWYNSVVGKWVIFNENVAAMSPGEVFNYYYGDDVGSVTSSTAFAVRLDSPGLNADPNGVPLAIHDWVAAYDTSPLSVDFGSPPNWYVFNDTYANMTTGERYFFTDARSHGGVATLTAANPYNSPSGTIGLYIDDARINGNPGAILLAQHNYVNAVNGSAMGVWYDSTKSKWIAYNESLTPLPMGEQVHYLIGTP